MAEGRVGDASTVQLMSMQVYKLKRVTCRALRNFACSSRVGLVQHEEYTAREQLLMS